MKLREIVSRITIETPKLTEYALNPENPQGYHKARVFAATLGYGRERYRKLIEQIENRVLDGEAVLLSNDQYGSRIRVDLEIVGTEGQRAIVSTGWLVSPGSDEARLITLYVRR